MTPEEFRAKWQRVTASERQAAQSHFEDLCKLLGVQTPLKADPSGTWYENVSTLNGRWPGLLYPRSDDFSVSNGMSAMVDRDGHPEQREGKL